MGTERFEQAVISITYYGEGLGAWEKRGVSRGASLDLVTRGLKMVATQRI
jgi:hypothetical protein